MLSYVNILCWKTLNNNFQHNSIYRHLIKTSKILTNYIIWNLPVSTGYINIWWTINMLTSLPQWNHCVGMSMKRNTMLKNYVQTKHCVEMSTQRKWLIDTNLSILMKKSGHSIFPGWSTLFLYSSTHKAWLFEKLIFELDAFSYNFKIVRILLRQLISPKKMVASSAKLTILISWFPICMPFVLVSTIMKLASTSVTILNMESIVFSRMVV